MKNIHDKEYYIDCYKKDIIQCKKTIADIEKQQAEDAKNSKAPSFKLESEKSILIGLMKKNLFLLNMIGVSTENLDIEEKKSLDKNDLNES